MGEVLRRFPRPPPVAGPQQREIGIPVVGLGQPPARRQIGMRQRQHRPNTGPAPARRASGPATALLMAISQIEPVDRRGGRPPGVDREVRLHERAQVLQVVSGAAASYRRRIAAGARSGRGSAQVLPSSWMPARATRSNSGPKVSAGDRARRRRPVVMIEIEPPGAAAPAPRAAATVCCYRCRIPPHVCAGSRRARRPRSVDSSNHGRPGRTPQGSNHQDCQAHEGPVYILVSFVALTLGESECRRAARAPWILGPRPSRPHFKPDPTTKNTKPTKGLSLSW